MKKLSTAFLFCLSAFTFQACNDNGTKETTTITDSLRDHSTTTMDSSNRDTQMAGDTNKVSNQPTSQIQSADKDATDFVLKAASGGMMEVELGKAAQQKASNQRVKDFGTMMVTDHSKANDELKSIASKKNITVPSAMMPEQQKNVDKLSGLSGAAFDKAYMNMMLDDHKKVISAFKKASENLKDADLKTFAGATIPTLQKHLDSCQAYHGKM